MSLDVGRVHSSAAPDAPACGEEPNAHAGAKFHPACRPIASHREPCPRHGVEASLYATVVIALLVWFSYRYYRRTEAARAGTPIPAPACDKGGGDSADVSSPT